MYVRVRGSFIWIIPMFEFSGLFYVVWLALLSVILCSWPTQNTQHTLLQYPVQLSVYTGILVYITNAYLAFSSLNRLKNVNFALTPCWSIISTGVYSQILLRQISVKAFLILSNSYMNVISAENASILVIDGRVGVWEATFLSWSLKFERIIYLYIICSKWIKLNG